jgi:hypothetical protein
MVKRKKPTDKSTVGLEHAAKKPAKCCPRCGGTNHQRSSSKHCRYYKPPKAYLERVPGVKEQRCTTKIGLGIFLSEKSLGPVIEDVVKRMTYITFEASRLANAFVLYLLERQMPIPCLDHNHFMCKVFQAVLRDDLRDPTTPKNTANDVLNHVRNTIYAACRPPGLLWNDGR